MRRFSQSALVLSILASGAFACSSGHPTDTVGSAVSADSVDYSDEGDDHDTTPGHDNSQGGHAGVADDSGDDDGDTGNEGEDGCGSKKPRTQHPIKNLQRFHNADGLVATYSTRDGRFLDTKNAFFDASLGTNGRACVTCHGAEDGFGLRGDNVRARFERSCGNDPLFRVVDGANSPTQDVSTLAAKRNAYSLLLKFGVIRIQIKPPATAQYTVIAVDDPYGNDLSQGISVYRRPLPSSNLAFVGGPAGNANGGFVMWDDREPNLKSQALHAIRGHAQSAADPSDAVLQQIVDFEAALFTAQVVGSDVGRLSSGGAAGGPTNVAVQPFFKNINRDMPQVGNGSQVCNPARPPQLGCAAFAILDNHVFQLYGAWSASEEEGRQQVARGEKLFNEHVFSDPRIGIPAGPAPVTCSGCHQTPNTGSMSGALTTRPFGAVANLRVSEFDFRQHEYPVYTLRNKASGATVRTTDPGKALVTGLWRDVNRVKIPTLRGLAARAPYFHNGAAATLGDVIDTYNRDFGTNFSADQKADLVAFLKTL